MKKLTKEIALKSVEEINSCRDDDEKAHRLEDELYHWFINCIAKEMYATSEMVEIANIVKSTSNIDFCRWYA